MTMPKPDADGGMSAEDTITLFDTLATVCKEDGFVFTLEYVPRTSMWASVLRNFRTGTAHASLGRYPVEAIWNILRKLKGIE